MKEKRNRKSIEQIARMKAERAILAISVLIMIIFPIIEMIIRKIYHVRFTGTGVTLFYLLEFILLLAISFSKTFNSFLRNTFLNSEIKKRQRENNNKESD